MAFSMTLPGSPLQQAHLKPVDLPHRDRADRSPPRPHPAPTGPIRGKLSRSIPRVVTFSPSAPSRHLEALPPEFLMQLRLDEVDLTHVGLGRIGGHS